MANLVGRPCGAVAAVILGLLSVTALSTRVLAGGVVGTGTGSSCTNAALNTVLSGGGSMTFNCGGTATIAVTSTKSIGADTTIDGASLITDGASLITIGGGNSVGIFSVNTGVTFTVRNLTIGNGNSGVCGGGISNVGITGAGSISGAGSDVVASLLIARKTAV